MSFMDRMKNIAGKGVEASKALAEKATDKAIELSEKGMLSLEINQQKNKIKEISEKVGTWVYQVIKIEGGNLPADNPTLAALLAEMEHYTKKTAELEAKLAQVGDRPQT